MAEKKSKTAEKAKPKEPYLKVPYHILNIRDLGFAEKMLLAHIYSFGEKGCWQSNETLAKIFMTKPRTVRRWLAKIVDADCVLIKSPKGYYRTIWARSHPDVRSIAELHYRGKAVSKTNNTNRQASQSKVDNNDLGRGQKWPSELARCGFRHGHKCPTTNNKTIKETIGNTTAPPSPLLPKGAPAVLVERRCADVRRIEDFKRDFGVARKDRKPLSAEQAEQRRQKQKMALSAMCAAKAV